MAFLELNRIAEDEAVALLLARRLVLDDNLRAQAHLVGRNLADVDARQLTEPLAQLAEAGLDELRQRLSKLSSIDISQIPADKVGLGSQVVVKDETTGEKESFSLVFGDSVEFEEGHVSMSSPIGLSLVGKAVGETTILRLPAKTRKLKIVELRTIHEG